MKPVVKSKSEVDIPDGVYVGKVGGYKLIILSQDQYGKEIVLECGIKTIELFVVVVVKNRIAHCFDRGFRMF